MTGVDALDVDIKVFSDSGYVFVTVTPVGKPMDVKFKSLTLSNSQYRNLTVNALKTALVWPSLKRGMCVALLAINGFTRLPYYDVCCFL